jgi:DNA-binding MurR/RpiR family transcriptional regulator
MPGGPRTYEELRVRLQELQDGLAPGQQRIANLVLSDPEGCAFWTVSDMARAAGVHESSVVRFATSLGLSGYPALVALCRQELSDQAQLVRRFERAKELGSADDLLAAVAADDQRNVERTLARIDPATWENAVGMLADAPAVHVLGMRKCFSIAHLLGYLLHLVRRDVRQINPTSGMLIDDLRDIAAGDAFVAISIHRYTADTVHALAYARERGLGTIALTDNAASPLVTHADAAFYVDSGGVGILRSVTAFTALVQTLATAVAVRLGTNTREELVQDERLLDFFDVYLEDGGRGRGSRTPAGARAGKGSGR